MANETPDLSGIVNLILSNPKLIEEIREMANRKNDASETATAAPQTPDAPPAERAAESTDDRAEKDDDGASESTAVFAAEAKAHRESRTRLFSALKPYLSEERRRAVDSMQQIADLIDVFKSTR